MRTEKMNILGIVRLKITCKWKRKMVSFVLVKKERKMFFVLSRAWDKEKTENMLFSCTDSDVDEA